LTGPSRSDCLEGAVEEAGVRRYTVGETPIGPVIRPRAQWSALNGTPASSVKKPARRCQENRVDESYLQRGISVVSGNGPFAKNRD